MPAFWLPVQGGQQMQMGKPPAKPGVVQQVDSDLRVESDSATLSQGLWTFSGHVHAFYGFDVLNADRLDLHMADTEHWGEASGHVDLVDPDGTVTADKLSFSWNPEKRWGKATNAMVHAADFMFTAHWVDMTADRWLLIQVEGTTCASERTPLYKVKADEAEIIPGDHGVLRHVRFYLFGRPVLALKSDTFGLSASGKGSPIPAISYRKGEGFGIKYSNTFPVSSRSVFSTGFQFFPGRFPRYQAEYTQSLIPLKPGNLPVPPKSEFQDRFINDFLDDIRLDSAGSETKLLRAPKSSITLGSYWKQSASEARGGHQFDKPAELNYEAGGSAGEVEEQAQFRVQSIRQDTGPLTNRFSWFNTLALRPHQITPTIQSRVRFDSNAYLGKSNFAWGRAEAGLYWQPSNHFGLGAAYAPAFEVGHSQFAVDRLLSTNAANLRTDVNFGPRKISYLLAYDLDGRGEFDHEFSATQAMGCLEFYVLYRRVTGTYQIGLRLRTQELVDKLKLRREQRETPAHAKPATGTPPPK